jgi:predicted  nucleic acid-binding Zn-ribbon protein
MYLKQIEQLVALQRVDSEILQLNSELAGAPKEIQVLEESFQKLSQELDQLTEKTNFLQEQEKKLNQEIEDDTLKIKKSKNKLMMVNNTKEYHAMMREMDNLEKINRLREEERVTLLEELSRQQQSQTELTEQSQTLRVDLDAKQANLQARVDETQKRLSQLDQERRNAGKNVPPPVLGRYEFIRSRLSAPVIVPVEGGVCGGCHISIPPQSYNELQKGQQILSCPNCQRLIYWSEHFTPPSVE